MPDCEGASVTVSKPVSVTVSDTDGAPQAGIRVYAFNGNTYTNFNTTTNAAGQATFTLPLGEYRFRADLNGTRFWSGPSNHCAIPGCENAGVTVSIPLVVSIQDADGAPQAGVRVYAFTHSGTGNGATYTNYNATSNAEGQAVFTLPLGEYRFRADFNGVQYWSGAANHCTVPGCASLVVTVGPQATATSTPSPTATAPVEPTPTAPLEPSPTATLEPTPTTTVEPVETSSPESGETPTPSAWQPGGAKVLAAAQKQQPNQVTVTVLDTNDEPKAGLRVYVFSGADYTGYSGTTDQAGLVTFTLPDGEYRFRADLNGTRFWSADDNHCNVPTCPSASVTVTIPVTVTALDTNAQPKSGLRVYAFDGNTYTNYSATTGADDQAVFTLPQGEYRFRADFNGTRFWSAYDNHCAIPDCESAAVTVTLPVTVTVLDTDGTPQAGLRVYAFDGATYTNYNATTNADGQAVFTLPQGEYRFRADLNGTRFWSSETNHCEVVSTSSTQALNCDSASVTVSKPVTVTVAGQGGQPYPGLRVYAFTDSTYTGYSGTTDASGHVTFTLPLGAYRFRADYDGVQFWSAETNTCPIPGCESASVTLPGGTGEMNASIEYEYDPLNRLVKATYTDPNNPAAGGRTYEYTYDAVGNRLSQTITINGLAAVTLYEYDAANRLTSAGVHTYTYDNNGNLLNDGVNTYTYDGANRLVSLASPITNIEYRYRCNGLSRDAWGITGCKSDRVSQTVNGVTTYYTLDQAAGLTQVLEDGANAYLYGAGRIAQVNTAGTEYFLGDALGSVRQMTDAAGAVTLAKAYDPYGVALQSIGNGLSNYGFTGELSDSTGLLYLRARYYAADTGRFISRDPWPGQSNRPLSLNRWAYVEANPINLTDPSGLSPYSDADIKACISSPKLNGLRTPMKESVCGMIAELKEEGYLMADMAYDVHIESAHRSPRDAHRYSTAWHILYDFVSIEDLRKTPKDLDGNVWYKDWWDGIYCATDENTYGNYGVGSYLYLVPDARRGLLDYYIKKNASDLSPETYREGRFGIKYITTKYGWSVPDHYYALEGWVGTRRLPNSSYPDVSKHVTGWAVDISRKTLRDDIWGQGGYTVIDEIADRYGLTRPYNNQEYVHYMPASDRHKLLREWWHFER